MDLVKELYGVPVIISPGMIVGYRQKRVHRKKRINKKYAKLYGRVPLYDLEHIYKLDAQGEEKLVMSKGMFEKLIKEVSK